MCILSNTEYIWCGLKYSSIKYNTISIPLIFIYIIILRVNDKRSGCVCLDSHLLSATGVSGRNRGNLNRDKLTPPYFRIPLLGGCNFNDGWRTWNQVYWRGTRIGTYQVYICTNVRSVRSSVLPSRSVCECKIGE